MSSNIGIHRVASVQHSVEMYGDFCANILVITDECGNTTALTLYRDAGKPLDFSAAPTVADHGWAASENNPANYPSEVAA